MIVWDKTFLICKVLILIFFISINHVKIIKIRESKFEKIEEKTLSKTFFFNFSTFSRKNQMNLMTNDLIQTNNV